ncbi:MAG TPA: pyruvate kinase [Gemmatimonadaceae bacterium]|nr:pyruvate kinase [Gemmatimonadaceae bacterium]
MSDGRTPAARVARTKIVCTLGPASSSPEVLRELVRAGMDVARINFSHGTHAQHVETIARVRAAALELGTPVAILGDVQGPRIRIGDLPQPLTLAEGAELVLVPEEQAAGEEIPVTYDALALDVDEGNRILVDDGLIDLIVTRVIPPRVHVRVVHGGALRSHKGMNLPGVQVSAPSITEKDRADIAFAVEQEVDYLALSFVRREEDVAGMRELLPSTVLVVAKIEKDTALDNIEGIVHASDAVMVARGDLGVELPFEEVPIAQKRIITLANTLGRPVITATQMLESMVNNPRPTRAEASDVANAILDGTDAVMLSAETATGAYPVLAVRAMSRIIAEIEKHPPQRERRLELSTRPREGKVSTERAIAAATVAAVRMIGAPVVIVFTKSGFTARIVSSHRPDVAFVALTDVERTYRQLALVWGAIPQLVPPTDDRSYADMVEYGLDAVRRMELAQPGDRVIVTAGVPFDVPGTTNFMKVEVV